MFENIVFVYNCLGKKRGFGTDQNNSPLSFGLQCIFVAKSGYYFPKLFE